MELFNLEVSKWSINIESYFGDFYIMHRTWMLAIGLIVVLRTAKIIRNRNNKNAEFTLSTDASIWND